MAVNPNAGGGGANVGTIVQAGFAVADYLNRGKGWDKKDQRNLEAALEAGYTVQSGRFPLIRDPSGKIVTPEQALRAGRDYREQAADAPPPAATPPFVAPTVPPAAGVPIVWPTVPTVPPPASSPSPDNWPALPTVPPPIVAGSVPGMGLPTPPRPSPWEQRRAADRLQWDKFLKDSRKPTKRARLRVKSAAEAQRERLAKIARQAVRRFPQIKKVAPVLARIPKGAGPTVAVTAAYQAGYWLGTKIYERITAEASRPAVAPRTTRIDPRRVDTPPPPSATRTAPVGQLPPPPRVAARQPSATSPRVQSSTSAPPRAVVGPSSSSSPWVSTLPAPRSTPAPATARAPLRIPRSVQLLAPFAIGLLSRSPGKKRRRLSDPLTIPSGAPMLGPLTGVQPYALPLRQPSDPNQRTKECKCEEPKRQRAKPRCRNPVTRRTKRQRGGALYVTTTRKIECQQ